jgi:hypothetical protein
MKTGTENNELLKCLNNKIGLIKMSKTDRFGMSYRQGIAHSDGAVPWTLITNLVGYMLTF